MKIISLSILALTVSLAEAQTTTTGAQGAVASPALPNPTAFSPVSSDGGSTVWERTAYSAGTNGTVVARKSRYTELSSGLNYRQNGQWVKSQEQINILPQGGAEAVQGQHQAHFPGDIYKGQIELVTPDNKHLKSRPLAISYDDSQNTVLIGQLKHSVGVLVASNRVIYPDAFSGIKADIVFEYRKGSFSQSVVLREQPPTPESLGLKAQAHLQLLTEFTGSPDPVQKTAARDAKDNLQDSTLSFGAGGMTMVQGKAFSMGGSGSDSAQNNQSRFTSAATGSTPTYKSWMHLQNRTFLIEELPYQRLATQLQQLPMTSRLETADTNLLAANSILGKVSSQRLLPPMREAETETGKILLASADWSRQPGVVLDYEAVDSSTADFTFQSDTTYYVSSEVYLSGLTTIAGGAVIKYDTNYICGVNILGTVQCTTSPDHPAILTSADDNSVGEAITTGGPNNGTGSLTLWVTGDSGVNLADLMVWIWDGNGNYIVTGQSLYWNGSYEPIIFPAGVGQGYGFGAVCDGEYWESSFWPTLNTGTLTLSSGSASTYQNLSYSETGDALATQAGAAVGLSLPWGSSVNDLVIRNLGTGLQSGYGLCSVTNVQFLHCGVAFDLEPYASLYAGNILMSQVDLGFSGQAFGATVEHLTFDQGACLAEDVNPGYYSFTLNNSLLTGIADYGNVAISTNEVVPLSSGAGVYATAGNANYFLAPNSPYRNTGTMGIAPDLWAELQMMTTYAPQDGGSPDNGMPDLGYHYPLDKNTDSDADDLPDWWEFYWFGNLSHAGSDPDGGGVNSLLDDYDSESDPNVIYFMVESANDYVNATSANVQLNITGGTPGYYAVFVNHTSTTNWLPFTTPNLTVTLGPTDGVYDVVVGLKGRPADATQTWNDYRMTLDRVPPKVNITNPLIVSVAGVGSATVNKPYLQLQGYANEQLAGLSYDIHNTAGEATDVNVFMTGRWYDTSKHDFTTNYFQAYDVPLVMNDNFITLHVTDRAGNTTTTNITVTLDYTTATSPTVTLLWPQDGMAVSGTGITIRGKTSDETGKVVAQVVNGNGVTTTLNGIVERNGMFWIENVPLNGTSQINIQTTDGSGNHVTQTPFTVSTGSFLLTIDSTPGGDALWQRTGSVSGRVGHAGATVTVNGKTATVDTQASGSSYNWHADGVPNNAPGMEGSAAKPQGTATYDATATANGQTVAADESVERAPCVFISEYHDNKSASSTSSRPSENPANNYFSASSGSRVKDYYTVYSQNPPSSLGMNYYLGTVFDHNTTTHAYDSSWTEIDSMWSDTDSSAHYTDNSGHDFPYNPLPASDDIDGSTTHLPDQDCWATGTIGWFPALYIYHYYADGVHWHWLWDYGAVGYDDQDVAVPSARTTVTLLTGGKSEINGQSLWRIQPWAMEYGRSEYGGWMFAPCTSVPNSKLLLMHKHVGSDGMLWVVLPDNSPQDITVTASGVKDYNAGPVDMNGLLKIVPDLRLGVDMNRDESIDFFDGTDATSESSPYRFWLNNNHDDYKMIGPHSIQQDVGGSADLSRTTINCTRDLEDYSRLGLWLDGINQNLLTSGKVVVKLESSGGPQVRIFQAVAYDSTEYLTVASTAQQQISTPNNTAFADNVIPDNFWVAHYNYSASYFLFDGIAAGLGNLKISLWLKDGQSLTKFAESQPVWLNLKDVKQMYDTWTVSGAPYTTASGSSVYTSASPETSQYILFVHGMGLSSDDKTAFANTSYKRLWWQNYKGRFGAFVWPCLGRFSYDASEYIAWQSATALANKLTDLNAAYQNNVYLFAHSQGNVVAGEALKLNNSNGNGVQSVYVACQAAVSAHAYDPGTANWTPIFGSSYNTPDDFANYWTPGAPCYFNGVTSGGSRANFFNQNDYALGWWVTDQRNKPDTAQEYSWNGTHYYEQIGFVISYPTDTYKIFAYCVQSRSFALGATPNVGGFGNVNLSGVWGNDPFATDPNKRFKAHLWHSAEFNFSTVEQWGWWDGLLGPQGFNLK